MIDREMAIGEWTEPYFVIPFARSDILATGFGEEQFELSEKSRHDD